MLLRIKEKKVGLLNGNFYPCPKRHYCVSTQSDKGDELNYIEPIKYNTSMEEAIRDLELHITDQVIDLLQEVADNKEISQTTLLTAITFAIAGLRMSFNEKSEATRVHFEEIFEGHPDYIVVH